MSTQSRGSGEIWSQAIHVVIDQAADGTIVAAVAGKRLRVLALVLTANGGVNTFSLRNTVANTRIIGSTALADDAHLLLPFSNAGWGESAVGEGILLDLLNATSVGGTLVYAEIE